MYSSSGLEPSCVPREFIKSEAAGLHPQVFCFSSICTSNECHGCCWSGEHTWRSCAKDQSCSSGNTLAISQCTIKGLELCIFFTPEKGLIHMCTLTWDHWDQMFSEGIQIALRINYRLIYPSEKPILGAQVDWSQGSEDAKRGKYISTLLIFIHLLEQVEAKICIYHSKGGHLEME